MRLKEDSSSWKSGGIIHRDGRNAKDDLKEKSHHKKKNTKKWCKGKVGVRHIESDWQVGTTKWMRVIRCTECNKILDYKFLRGPDGK